MRAWQGWRSQPATLAAAWPAAGPCDTPASPGGAAPAPTPGGRAVVPAPDELDLLRLEAGSGLGPWRALEAWLAATAEMLEAAAGCEQRDEAAVALMDVAALADPGLAVWGCAEAARLALTAQARPQRSAFLLLDGLYASSRPSPQIVRRAVNATPVVEVSGRVYVV